jgi:PIN domain-containing protein
MKKKFKGYYKLTEREIKRIWDNGFISFDTNILLNLYRYSKETTEELLKIIQNYSDNIWLPYHTAYEFHKNRLTVINEQIKVYEDTIKNFEKLENDIVKNVKSPHLSNPVLKKFKATISETKKDLEKRKKYFLTLLSKDTILTKITQIFNGKIGESFTKDEISKIEKEGEERFKNEIPPGYKDSKKTGNKFGDVIIWKELIRKAKNENKPFILITDDVKEDWFVRMQGQTLSPRQELSQELYVETGQNFYLYTADRFLEYSGKGKSLYKKAIEEVREARKKIYEYPVIQTDIYNDYPRKIFQIPPSSVSPTYAERENYLGYGKMSPSSTEPSNSIYFNPISSSLNPYYSEPLTNPVFFPTLQETSQLQEITSSIPLSKNMPSTRIKKRASKSSKKKI